MEKKKKRIIIGITAAAVAAAAVAVALVLYFAKGYEIRFEETFAEDLTFEYGQEADIPKAYVVNKHGIRQFGRVTYLFTSAEGTETKTNYPVAKCDSVGDWTVTCSYENAELQKHFRVVDTVAPEIIVGALPSDVFVGNTDVEYTVPGFDIKDSSPIDYDNCSATLFFEGEQVKYNTLTNAFVPERDGEYVFKLKAADIYGNTSEKECRWRAKDADWTDQDLPDGYLATFDSIGYANLISSGFINEYWDGTEVEEFLEEYEGEKGVLKVSAAYNVLGLTAFKVKLAKAITPKQLGDNVVIIRYRVDSKNTNGILTVAGNYQETIQSAAAKSAVFAPGEWQTVTLTAEDLTKYAYTDEDGVFRSLQLGLSRNGCGSSVDVYLASITIGRKLEAPKNLGLSGGSLKWDPVKGATGYYLFADGEETELGADITSYPLGKHKIFKVRAKGDGLFTVDSDESIYVNDTPAEGYLAEFDEAYYQYLVWNNGARAEGGMEWYESDSFEAAYDDKEKALRLDLTQGYVAAGIVVRLPKAAETDSLDHVVIRFKSDGSVKCVRAYQYGGPALLLETTDIKEGWNSLVIPKNMLAGDASDTGSFSGFQLMFYANEKPTNGKGQGTKMTVYLGTVTRAVQLDAPTNLKLSGNKLTWEAVANAKGYVVEEDGKKHSVNDTSYTIKGGELFQVYAAGDNKFYVNSEKTILVNGSVAEGYLASFDRPFYEYLIWNNGASAPGGMQWYESAAFLAKCDTANQKMDVTATFGYVCAGMVVKFPQEEPLQTGKDVVVNIKLDDNVKCVSLYPYGVEGLLLKVSDVTSGWNRLVIPAEKLAAAVGGQEFKGLQVILHDNAEGGFTQSGTALQTTVSIGKIYYASSLAKPTLTLEGTTVNWPAVEDADSYDIDVNDEWKCNQTSTSYSVAGLANGIYSIKVVAKSDKEIYLDAASDAVKYSNLEFLNVPVLTYQDGTVSFTSVSGAAGYKIEINGTEYDIDKSAVSVKPAELIGKQILVKYRMKAVGDNQTTTDSEWSDYQIQDLLLEEGYIADFDEGYTALVWNNGANAEGGQQWYESDSFKASYDSEEEGIRLALKHGYVCAGFILRFPQTVQKSEIDNLVLRIKLDENVKKLQVFEYNGTGVMMEFKDLKAGWNELIIPRASLKNDPGKDYISGLQIAMYTSNNSALGDSQGRDITVVLGSVRNMKNTEPEYKDITITGIDGNTNATAIYLNLSAGTGVGTWASFASDSALTTEGILYNGVKLAVNAQTTWVENMFCIQPGRTPMAGDILKITGTFKCGDVGIKVAEYALQYTGTTWVVYEEGDYDLIRITGVESAYTNASAIYLNLSAGTGVSAWASFASDSILETEGILYNGVKLAINAQTTWAANMFCIQPGRTPVTGDKIKIAGTFKCGDVGIRVAEYVLQYNGTTWVAYEGAETSSRLMIQGGLGAAIRSRVLRDGKEHL